MAEYRFEDMGWVGFERMCIALLKTKVSAAVDATGGHNDWGQDALLKGDAKTNPLPAGWTAPIVFQAKFIERGDLKEHAEQRLTDAIAKESRRIAERRTKGNWTDPATYVLMTNADVSPDLRRDLTARMEKALPKVKATVLARADLAGWLDSAPDLRRSYPQLLSIQDLSHLIEAATSRGIRQRTAAQIAYSAELVRTFVPTGAYFDAAEKVNKHFFVVLDGPPEVGKTTIASVLALQFHLDGWEFHDIESPDEFFQLYHDERPQVFVADDTFGKTAYEVSKGSEWQRGFHKVVVRLNANHLLIWTSRKHILQHALATMDLQGQGKQLPVVAEVLVAAGRLSEREKVLMLHQHACVHPVTSVQKEALVASSQELLRTDAFTPWRISEMFSSVLPEVSVTATREEVRALVLQYLHDPSGPARKAVRALSASHRLGLAALVGTQSLSTTAWQGAMAKCDATITGLHFAEIRDDLLGTFVRSTATVAGEGVTWIHPSYGDLLTEELVRDDGLLRRWLNLLDAARVGTILQLLGGSADALLPQASRQGLHEHILMLGKATSRPASHPVLASILDALPQFRNQTQKAELKALVGQLVAAWLDSQGDDPEPWDPDAIRLLGRARGVAGAVLPWPALAETWDDAAGRAMAFNPDVDSYWHVAQPLDVMEAIVRAAPAGLPDDAASRIDDAIDRLEQLSEHELQRWSERGDMDDEGKFGDLTMLGEVLDRADRGPIRKRGQFRATVEAAAAACEPRKPEREDDDDDRPRYASDMPYTLDSNAVLRDLPTRDS